MDEKSKSSPDIWRKAGKGIRYRLHPTRKHGKQPDRYYAIRYVANGQKKQEALGWASDGWTLDKAQEQLSKLKSCLKTGEGAQSLAEKRLIAQKIRDEAELARQEESKKGITLSTYYLKHYKVWKTLVRPEAFRKEASHYEHWLGPLLGSYPIRSIDLEQWYLLVSHLRQGGLSQRTVEYICGTLRRIIKHAMQQNVVTTAPPSAAQIGATSPRDNRRIRILSSDELAKLMANLQYRDLNAWRITTFAMVIGCRFSDAARLLWGHIDFERKMISFVKTKTVARVVPVGDELLSFLRSFGPGIPKEHVFVNSQGGVYKEAPSALKSAANDLKLNEGRAKNDCFSFHSLRHMAATDLAKDLLPRDLMDFMGWKTPAMAFRYMHGNEAAQRAAITARSKHLTHIHNEIQET